MDETPATGVEATSEEPVFKLPPFEVEAVFTSLAETTDWGLKLLGVPELWNRSKGAGIKVAVLDTGVDLNHRDLKAALVAHKDFTGSPRGSTDVQGHGTHCLGVIGARINDTGVIGVAPECSLYSGKVLDDSGSGTMDAIVAGIDWAIAQRVDVISMSLGAPVGAAALAAAVQRALAAGIVVVAAAGNEGPGPNTVGFPAQYPGIICVGAINASKGVTDFSSRGPRLDVVAPGDKVLSCYPPDNFARLSGTSMATPFIAGIVALMLAADRLDGQRKLKSPVDVRKALIDLADDGGPPGADPSFGWGIVSPKKLLDLVKDGEVGGGDPPPVMPSIFLVSDADLTDSGLARMNAFLGYSLPETGIKLRLA